MSNSESMSDNPTPEAENAAAATGESAGADLAAQLDAARKERDENRNHYMRALADLENYRRRVVREKEEIRQFGTKDVMESLVPIVESLSLAVASARQATDPQVIAGGVSLVLDQFRATLSSKGLVEVDPAVGSDFDPHQHESIAHLPSDSVPEEKILQVARTGFSLNGRLLRPASVVLSSGTSAAS